MDRSTALNLLFWCAAAVAAFGQIRVLISGLAGRTPPSSASASARAREALWIVVPAVVLALTLVLTYAEMTQRLPTLGHVSGSAQTARSGGKAT